MKTDQQITVPTQSTTPAADELITRAWAQANIQGSVYSPVMTGGPSSEMVLTTDGDSIVAAED